MKFSQPTLSVHTPACVLRAWRLLPSYYSTHDTLIYFPQYLHDICAIKYYVGNHLQNGLHFRDKVSAGSKVSWRTGGSSFVTDPSPFPVRCIFALYFIWHALRCWARRREHLQSFFRRIFCGSSLAFPSAEVTVKAVHDSSGIETLSAPVIQWHSCHRYVGN